MSRAWLERPKGLSERSYRKYMAKKKEVLVNGNKFVLQSVSPRWYFDLNDRCGMTGGKKRTADYIDELFKNVVRSEEHRLNSSHPSSSRMPSSA